MVKQGYWDIPAFIVGGSDPIRTREYRVVKHHLITSLCVFFPLPAVFCRGGDQRVF